MYQVSRLTFFVHNSVSEEVASITSIKHYEICLKKPLEKSQSLSKLFIYMRRPKPFIFKKMEQTVLPSAAVHRDRSSQKTMPQAYMSIRRKASRLKLMAPSSTSGAMYRRVPTYIRLQVLQCFTCLNK